MAGQLRCGTRNRRLASDANLIQIYPPTGVHVQAGGRGATHWCAIPCRGEHKGSQAAWRGCQSGANAQVAASPPLPPAPCNACGTSAARLGLGPDYFGQAQSREYIEGPHCEIACASDRNEHMQCFYKFRRYLPVFVVQVERRAGVVNRGVLPLLDGQPKLLRCQHPQRPRPRLSSEPRMHAHSLHCRRVQVRNSFLDRPAAGKGATQKVASENATQDEAAAAPAC